MKEDCKAHVKTYLQYQKYANLEKQPTQELNYIVSPCPFSTWGINLIGIINSHSCEGHKFVITSKKFTIKWVEAIPMKSVTQDKIIAFLIENIITRFSVKQRLIMENGKNFKGKEMKYFYKKFHII